MHQVTQRIVAMGVVLLLTGVPCAAAVSTNVPLGHWSYAGIDKLADYGLIDGAMLTVRPITRLEMARHVSQATANLNYMGNTPPVLQRVVERLHDEYRDELIQLGAMDGWSPGSFIKPVEDPYGKYLYADKTPDLENVRGDAFKAQSNYRAGFAARATWEDTVAFYAHPEFSTTFTDDDQHLTLIEGYGKSMAGPIEIEVGKDSLWWGPARRGSMLMSNNARPLPMVKISTPQPVELPWGLSRVGPLKAEWFLAELEEDRDYPHAKLSGLRLNIKPHPLLELGASRVIMFGGSGLPHVGLIDYGKMVFATEERSENNQLAGIDGSVRVPLGDNPLLRSVRFYVDAAGEDAVGAFPSKWGEILGVQLSDILKTGRTDLRVEYADDHVQGHPGVFYTHGLYTSGYTYRGRVLGHYMGTESHDFSVHLSHYLTDDLVTEVTFDRLVHAGTPKGVIDIYQYNLTFFPSSDWRIEGGYRYEQGQGRGFDDNHILQLQVVRHF